MEFNSYRIFFNKITRKSKSLKVVRNVKKVLVRFCTCKIKLNYFSNIEYIISDIRF